MSGPPQGTACNVLGCVGAGFTGCESTEWEQERNGLKEELGEAAHPEEGAPGGQHAWIGRVGKDRHRVPRETSGQPIFQREETGTAV